MRAIYLRSEVRRNRGDSSILALFLIVCLVCIVIFLKWYLKSPAEDPDLYDYPEAWKEWRLRELSQKPEQEKFAEQPDIRDLLRFDTNLSDKDNKEPRGELAVLIEPGGSVSGRWYGLYWKTRTRNFQVIGGEFGGKVYPAKIYRDEAGVEDPSKLYFMAKGEFLAQETDTDKGGVYNRAGDIYVRGWLKTEYMLTGEVTITSDEKYFETFTWRTYKRKR